MSRDLLLTAVAVASFTLSLFMIAASIKPVTGDVIAYDSLTQTYSLRTDAETATPPPSNKKDPLENPTSYYLNIHPQMIIWTILMSSVIALSTTLLPWLLTIFGEVRRNYNLAGWRSAMVLWGVTIGTFLLVIGLDGGLGPYIVKPIDLLQWGFILNPKTLLFALVFPIIVAVLGALVTFLIHVAFRNLPFNDPGFIEKSSDLHKKFELITSLTAFAIALALFANASLIETINKQLCGSCEFLPRVFGYSYGLIFSIFLAALYFPIAHNFSTRNRAYIFQKVELVSEEKQQEARKLYEQKLSLENTTANYLQALFSTAAPLVGSLLPEFLGMFSN